MPQKKTKKTSSSPINAQRIAASRYLQRAKNDYTRQMQEGETTWEELSEMQRWMWIGAVVSKDAGEADHAAAVQ